MSWDGHDMIPRWLSIVGIGEDGRSGLSPAACALLDGAQVIFGGPRHLDLAGPTTAEKRAWTSPLEGSLADILARRGTAVCVLASGDPFWFGIGVTLARTIPVAEMTVIPAPSSLSLAAARLGWALQTTTTLGLNMAGSVPSIRRHLHDGRRILALSLGSSTPADIADTLRQHGYGRSRLSILEALGGPHERIRHLCADSANGLTVDALNIVAVEVVGSPTARPIPFAPGLADDMFEHDGQLTKREIRAVTVSSLAPCAGELLWDVGLGSGSVAIEWLLAHSSMRAVGFERSAERAARAARNAAALGVPQLEIRHGSTAAMFEGLATPDAIFVGGGATEPGMIDACWSALKPGGRMVVNAVTIETEAVALAARARWGGTVARIAIDRLEAVGRFHGWRPSMPVVQWAGRKP